MEPSATTSPTASPRAPLAWRGFVSAGAATMVVLATSDTAWARFEDATGGRPSRSTIRRTLAATGVVHAAEALLVHRRATAAGLAEPARWARQTLLWGFPVMLRLRCAETS